MRLVSQPISRLAKPRKLEDAPSHAKALSGWKAKSGGSLLLIGRNPHKGEAAVAEIKRVYGNDAVAYSQADLSLVKNGQGAAERVRETFDGLNVQFRPF